MKKANVAVIAIIVLVLLVGCSKAVDLVKNEDEPFNFGSGFDGNTDATCIQNNKLLVSGSFNKYNGISVGNIVRLNPNGTLDNSFVGGKFNGAVKSIQAQSDKILVGGNFTLYNGVKAGKLIRLNNDGSIDNSFKAYDGEIFSNTFLKFSDEVISIKLQGDKILALLSSSVDNGRLVRFNNDGSLDQTFGINGVVLTNFDVSCFCLSGSDIYMGGTFDDVNGYACNNLVKLDKNGVVLQDFNFSDNTVTYVKAISDDGNGGCFIGGNFGIIKVSANGSHTILSNSYQVDSMLYDDGKLTCSLSSYEIIRLNSNGNPDESLKMKFDAAISSICFNDKKNRIYVAGTFTNHIAAL